MIFIGGMFLFLGISWNFTTFHLEVLPNFPSLPRLSVSERNNEVFDICRASWPSTSGYEEHPSISISFRSAQKNGNWS